MVYFQSFKHVFLFLHVNLQIDVFMNTLNQTSKSPPSIFSYISKSILPILIIQTVMNAQFSYAQIEL